MFNLTKASKETKLIMKIGLIALGVLFVLYIIFQMLIAFKNILFSTEQVKASVEFGKLTYPDFPKNTNDKEFEYSINTVTGDLPQITDIVKVNKIERPLPDLLGLKNAGEKVSKAKFDKGPTKITDTVYDWVSEEGLKKTIRVNILNKNFSISSNPYSDQSILSAVNLPNEKGAIEAAKSLLESMRYPTDDLDIDNAKTKLFYIDNNTFKEATSISTAQAIQVNFYQKPIDEIPIIYKNPNQSNINFLVAGGEYKPQIIGANYIYQNITEEASTYPIKTAKQAYEDLVNGKAFIASNPGNDTNISITNVYLAYYLSDDEKQSYTMPVIVFQGNENFFAYVNAIRDEWLSK